MRTADYTYGWDDCLEVVTMILAEEGSLEKKMETIAKLQGRVKNKKFEKIRVEMGIFGAF